jgi:putative acetyltransferase
VCSAIPNLGFRPETPGDINAIHDLTARAFAQMSFSDGTEPQVIRRLRARGELILSLLALDGDGKILAHVAFSPVTIPGQSHWLGLGPISVEPAHQRRGIGRALVHEAIARLRQQGVKGIALIGNPLVYGPMGFVSCGRLTYAGLRANLVQHMTLKGTEPQGELRFSSAFDADGA